VAVSPEGLVAVAHSTDYVIELWQVDGTHLGVIRREPEWFVTGPESGPSGGPGPADPLQESPRLGPDGRLWTVVHVADDDWRESLGPTRSILGGDGPGVPSQNLGGYIDSVVEVFDVNSGQLLGSARVDPHMTFISDLGHAYSYREDEYGQPFVDVWQFRIVPKP